MTRILDIEKVQAALDRAADASLHGDREDRNGKYDGGNRTSARKVALRIRDEIRIAIRNWATVEAYNNQGERLQELLEANNAWRPAHSAVKALVRDVIAALMRLTDGPGNARESLCGLVVLLDNKNATELAQATGANRDEVESGLCFVLERVPLKWGKTSEGLANNELFELRTRFRPIRDSLIAHAMDYSSLDLRADVPKTRDFLNLVSRLSDAACQICNVPRDDLQTRWNASLHEATQFWNIVASGCGPQHQAV